MMKMPTSIIDSINQRTMSASVGEYSDIVREGFSAAEGNALAGVIDAIKNGRILDIGVGAGRTVKPLLDISRDYIGVDYVKEMVEHCRATFPGVRFEQADARAMPQFADRSFDLIVFACNGISMVDQAGRLAILREARRLLAPNGYFLFSTCNRNSPEHDCAFAFPPFQTTKNPAKLGVRALRFVGETLYRLNNRRRFKRYEIKTSDYSILNDRCHHYRTMLYFIDIDAQLRQLQTMGFTASAAIYDIHGQLTDRSCRDHTLTFLIGSQSPGS